MKDCVLGSAEFMVMIPISIGTWMFTRQGLDGGIWFSLFTGHDSDNSDDEQGLSDSRRDNLHATRERILNSKPLVRLPNVSRGV